MADYKFYRKPFPATEIAGVIYKSKKWIPADPNNSDYQVYLEWAKTNTADESESAWDQVRGRRDALLKDSDWTMVTGVTVDQAQWAAYRDKLRAIPQTFKNVSDPLTEITWPTAPSTKGPNTD